MKNQYPSVQTSITIYNSSQELDFDYLLSIFGPDCFTRSLNNIAKTGQKSKIRISEVTYADEAAVIDSVNIGLGRLIGEFQARWVDIGIYCDKTDSQILLTSRVEIDDWGDRPIVELDSATINHMSKISCSWRLDLVDFSR